MAEVVAVIGVVASVASITAEGIKVFNALNTYIDGVKYAEEDAKYIASEIKDTTVILGQLEDNLRLEQQSIVCKPEFYDAITQKTQDCAAIFKEIDDKVHDVVDIVTDEEGKVIVFELKGRGRLRWPFKQNRMTLLRGNLNQLKTTLNFMMSIMSHARSLHEKELHDRDNALGLRIEKSKIKTLELETEAAQQRYRNLKRKANPAVKNSGTRKDAQLSDGGPNGPTPGFSNIRGGRASAEWNESSTLTASSNTVRTEDEEDMMPEDSTKFKTTPLANLGSQTGYARTPSTKPGYKLPTSPARFTSKDLRVVKWNNNHDRPFRHAAKAQESGSIADQNIQGRTQKNVSKPTTRASEPTHPVASQGSRSSLVLHPGTVPKINDSTDTSTDESEADGSAPRFFSNEKRDLSDPGEGPSELFTADIASTATNGGFDNPPDTNRDLSDHINHDSRANEEWQSQRRSLSARESPMPSKNPDDRNEGKGKAKEMEASESGPRGASTVVVPDSEIGGPDERTPLRDGPSQSHSPEKNLYNVDRHLDQLDASGLENEALRQSAMPSQQHQSEPVEGTIEHQAEGRDQETYGNSALPTKDIAVEESNDGKVKFRMRTNLTKRLFSRSEKLRSFFSNRPGLVLSLRQRKESNESDTEQELAEQPAHARSKAAAVPPRNDVMTSPSGQPSTSHQQTPVAATSFPPTAKPHQGYGDLAHQQQSLGGNRIPYPSFDPAAAQYERRTVGLRNLPASSARYNIAEDHLVILEAWVFRRADPSSRKPKSWAEVTRHLLPIADFEMQVVIQDQEKAGRPVWDLFDLLSTYQQRHIHSLFREKQDEDPYNRFNWILRALKTSPKRAKTMEIKAIQAILERRPRLGSRSYRPPDGPDPVGHSMQRTSSFERPRPAAMSSRMPSAPEYSFERSKPLSKSLNMPPAPPPDFRAPRIGYSHRPRSHHVSFDSDIENSSWDGDYSEDSFDLGLERARRYSRSKSQSDDRHTRQSSSSKKSASRASHSNRDKEKQMVLRNPSKTRQIYDLKESVAFIEDDLSDMDRKLEKKFAKMDKQLALRNVEEKAIKGQMQEQVQVKDRDDNSIYGPHYSGATFDKATIRPQMPPSPTPSITVDNLLSKWTLVNRGPTSGVRTINDVPKDTHAGQKQAVGSQETPDRRKQEYHGIFVSSTDKRSRQKLSNAGSSSSSLTVGSMD